MTKLPVPTAKEINDARVSMWTASASRNRDAKPTPEQEQSRRSALTCAKASQVAKQYDYRRVKCTDCGWRGRRGFNVTWPACPRCLAPGDKVKFSKIEDAGKEPHG